MEGRLRVSVVATGIEAESLARMPPNVQPLRPHAKQPVNLKPEPKAEPLRPMSPALNPVRRQVETIAEEMNAPSMRETPPLSETDSYILGAEDAPMIEEEDVAVPVAIRPQTGTRADARRGASAARAGTRQAPLRLFGPRKEKKPEARIEPAAAPRPAVAPAARARPRR